MRVARSAGMRLAAIATTMRSAGYGDEGESVASADAVDHALDQTAERVGCDESDDDTDRGGLDGLSDDEPHDVAASCSKGDAQADVFHAAFYRVGEHAVDADGAEDESEQAEDGEKLHVEAVSG